MRLLLVFIFSLLSLNASLGQELNVMTYNIRLDTPDDGINQWPKRVDKVVELIRKHNPDILGVQEALHHQLEDLIRFLPDYSYCGVGRDDGKEKGEYSAILFRNDRFGVLEQKTFWLSETPEVPGSKSWDAAITRIATNARFFDRKENIEFSVINTHFDHMGEQARVMSAIYLKDYIVALRGKSNKPVLLMGDFNSLPTEPAYVTLVSADEGEVLVDTKPVDDANGTYCGFKVGAMECKPIDFIFVTEEWLVLEYEVIKEHDSKHYPSDHLPVMVTVLLPK